MELTHSVILPFGFLWYFCRGQEIDWCSMWLRCGDVKNTMCAFASEDENAGNCTAQKDLVLTNEDIQDYWLALHNTFRDQVAAGYVPGMPSAANMLQLVWDDGLEQQARRWAFQCRYEDDHCTRTPAYGGREPEIVHNETQLTSDLVKNTRAAILTRFLQNVEGYDSFPSNLIDEIDDAGFSTYHQVNLVVHTFAQIRKVGAALILYKWDEGGALYPFLKSNTYFGPPIGQGPVYKRGTPCSECPDGFRCNRRSTYIHLCAALSDSSHLEYTDGLPGAALHEKDAATTSSHICSCLLLASIHFQIDVRW